MVRTNDVAITSILGQELAERLDDESVRPLLERFAPGLP